jgi:hypothetical protein
MKLCKENLQVWKPLGDHAPNHLRLLRHRSRGWHCSSDIDLWRLHYYDHRLLNAAGHAGRVSRQNLRISVRDTFLDCLPCLALKELLS